MKVNRIIIDVPSVTTTVVTEHLWQTSLLPVATQQISSGAVPRKNTLSFFL